MFLLEEKGGTSQKTLVVPRDVSIPDEYGKIINMIEVEAAGPIPEFIYIFLILVNFGCKWI